MKNLSYYYSFFGPVVINVSEFKFMRFDENHSVLIKRQPVKKTGKINNEIFTTLPPLGNLLSFGGGVRISISCQNEKMGRWSRCLIMMVISKTDFCSHADFHASNNTFRAFYTNSKVVTSGKNRLQVRWKWSAALKQSNSRIRCILHDFYRIKTNNSDFRGWCQEIGYVLKD